MTDIVIVNEFSLRLPSGKGSRGMNPGNYILQYMARDDAIEQAYVPGAQKPSDGAAFGRYTIAMLHKELTAISKRIQKAFEKGKTVLKTVISFTHEYLRKMRVISEDFICEKAGDYKGHVDQLKLRKAIQKGYEGMIARYDDPEWVGVIQVDTNHVHCHICLVDHGKGSKVNQKIASQDGTIKAQDSRRIRMGIHNCLESMKELDPQPFFVRQKDDKVFQQIEQYTQKQSDAFAVSNLLPKGKELWVRGSEAMKEADDYVRVMLERRLRHRYGKEPDAEVVNRKMDSFYESLQKNADLMEQKTSQLLNQMSLLKLRLDMHQRELEQYQEDIERFEKSRTSRDAVSLLRYYRLMADYHDRMVYKYQRLLYPGPCGKDLEVFAAYQAQQDLVNRLHDFENDPAAKNMSAAQLQIYGEKHWQISNGSMLAVEDVWEQSLARQEEILEERLNDLKHLCKQKGFGLYLQDTHRYAAVDIEWMKEEFEPGSLKWMKYRSQLRMARNDAMEYLERTGQSEYKELLAENTKDVDVKDNLMRSPAAIRHVEKSLEQAVEL